MNKFILFCFYMILALNCFADQVSTITVTGNVHVAACRVDPSSQNVPVDLGKHSIYQLKNIGDSTDPVTFSIDLEDCPETTNSALIKLDGFADADNNQLIKLDDMPDSASGVGVAVYDNTGTIVPLWMPSAAYQLQKGSNLLSFTAKYVVSKLPVTNGIADATVSFTLNYQ